MFIIFFFNLLYFFLKQLNMTPLSETERHIHYVVRERLSGYCLNGPKSRGVVLSDMANEMKQLKEDLANKKNSNTLHPISLIYNNFIQTYSINISTIKYFKDFRIFLITTLLSLVYNPISPLL